VYDHEISVSIQSRIRNEQHFESLAILKEQLKKDKLTALTYFENHE
jgi:riboflavin kinase/FMN adenylyltransferase